MFWTFNLIAEHTDDRKVTVMAPTFEIGYLRALEQTEEGEVLLPT